MKFGINTLLFTGSFTDQEAALFGRFKDMGFDGVEIALGQRGDFDYATIRRALEDNGLECSSLCGLYGEDRDLRGPGQDVMSNALSYIRDCIDGCTALGADLLVGPAYSAVGRADLVPEDQRAEQWETVVGNLKEVCGYAESRGVCIAVEPLNRFETDFLNVCADAVRLVRDVGSPSLKIHLDTFHMHIEEKSSGAAVIQAGELLRMVHASENDRGAPGTGQVHWQEIAHALREIGYDGWVVIESFTPDIKMIARAASIWRQTEKDAMTLAGKGLRFLKSLL